MKLLTQILMLYNWGAVCVLLFFLFGIAQFFERRLSEKNSTRKKRLHYPFFLVPIFLFAVSTFIYIFSETLIVGNFWADTLRIIGSAVFAYFGYALFRTMVGGRPWHPWLLFWVHLPHFRWSFSIKFWPRFRKNLVVFWRCPHCINGFMWPRFSPASPPWPISLRQVYTWPNRLTQFRPGVSSSRQTH